MTLAEPDGDRYAPLVMLQSLLALSLVTTLGMGCATTAPWRPNPGAALARLAFDRLPAVQLDRLEGALRAVPASWREAPGAPALLAFEVLDLQPIIAGDFFLPADMDLPPLRAALSQGPDTVLALLEVEALPARAWPVVRLRRGEPPAIVAANLSDFLDGSLAVTEAAETPEETLGDAARDRLLRQALRLPASDPAARAHRTEIAQAEFGDEFRAAEEPAADEPSRDESPTAVPAAEEPAADEPSRDESPAEAPAAEEPAATEPATDEQPLNGAAPAHAGSPESP